MDHKDLLDDVVKSMAATSTTPEEKTEDIDTSDYIVLPMSDGSGFLIDPKAFDWDKAFANIPLMEQNKLSVRRMVATLAAHGHETITEEDDTATTYAKKIIADLTNFLEQYNITNFDYRSFCVDATDNEIALIMAFDCMNILDIICTNTQVKFALSAGLRTDELLAKLASAYDADVHVRTEPEPVEESGITYVESDEETEKELMYVTGRFGPDDDGCDRLIEITDIAPHYGEAIDPSKQYIVDILDDETVGVFIMAKNLTDARKIATDVFDAFFEDQTHKETVEDDSMSIEELMSSFTFEGVDDHDVSGLLEH